MKKYGMALILGAVALAFGACDKETYQHGAGLLHPYPGTFCMVFADQTVDSVAFYTYDSYKVTTESSFITVDSKWGAYQFNNTYWNCWEFHVPLAFTPNTTGKFRQANVNVTSYGVDDWSTKLDAGYIQSPCHNVLRPAPDYGKYEVYPESVQFELKDSADAVLDSLCFYAHDAWTLSQQGESFVHFTTESGLAGAQVIKLTLDANPEDKPRSAQLTLKSNNGVSTDIRVTQVASKAK